MPAPGEASNDKAANQRSDGVAAVDRVEVERHQISALMEEVAFLSVSQASESSKRVCRTGH